MIIFLILLNIGCSEQKSQKIKEDTKMRLWLARNTVLLYDQCYKGLSLKENSSEEEYRAALANQKKLCEKYQEKESALLKICLQDVPKSINDEHAPIDDQDYADAKNELLKICSVVESKNKK